MTQPRSAKPKQNKIVIIGRGKVGQSLTQLFETVNYSVANIGRSRQVQVSMIRNADIVLLCVDDASIESLCKQLAPDFPKDCIVSHCSGALDSMVLSSARENGCAIASTHPLNSFPTVASGLSLFSSKNHGSYLYAEGDARALETLHPLFKAAGFISLSIERKAKPVYHAACVFACNYLTSLMDMSLESAAAAGLDRDQFWASLQPLIQTTLENIDDKGVVESLSGPIARGDHSTVASHLQGLEKHSKTLKRSYVDLGLRALEIAIKKNELSNEQLESLRKALNQTS